MFYSSVVLLCFIEKESLFQKFFTFKGNFTWQKSVSWKTTKRQIEKRQSSITKNKITKEKAIWNKKRGALIRKQKESNKVRKQIERNQKRENIIDDDNIMSRFFELKTTNKKKFVGSNSLEIEKIIY